MANSSRRFQPAIKVLTPLLLFLAIVVPRVVALDLYVTADEGRWLERSAKFTAALVHRDWDATFQREHPAVTTQWAGMLGLLQVMPDFPRKTLADFETYNQMPDFWPEVEEGITPLNLLVAGRRWTIVFVGICLVLAYFAFKKLLGAGLAALAILFVAWSPMSVAFTRLLHPDGLVSVLSLTAFAFFLVWLYGVQRRRYLVTSGLLMGLAWLSKTPAAALVLAGAGVLALELWQQRAGERRPLQGPSPAKLIFGFVAWGAIAAMTFVFLWPVMWTSPVQTFQQIYATMTDYSGGHGSTNFFLGRAVDDPGILFYPVAYLFRTTPGALVGLLAACTAYLKTARPFDRMQVRKTSLAMCILASAFVVLMSLVGKKFDRYILATFLALDVVAALGWAALALWASDGILRLRLSEPKLGDDFTRRSRVAPVVALLVLLLGLAPMHGLQTTQHYPYYLTYFNPLVGGTHRAPNVMFTGWGEGLEQVGAWLDEQPAADLLTALSWYWYGSLSYYFSGDAVGVHHGSRVPWLDADFMVLYMNQVQRDIPTPEVVDFFLAEEPVQIVTIKGIPMARVYDLNAIVSKLLENVPEPVGLASPELDWPTFELSSVKSLHTAPIPSALPVQLTWTGEVGSDLKVSLRLISETDTLVAQEDRPLGPEMLLTLFVPPDAQPGTYSLLMLVYEEESKDPVVTNDGQSLISIASIELN